MAVVTVYVKDSVETMGRTCTQFSLELKWIVILCWSHSFISHGLLQQKLCMCLIFGYCVGTGPFPSIISHNMVNNT